MAEELPVRLAHRVKDLSDLPSGLGEMPSIVRVKEWYAQSFEVCIFPAFTFSKSHFTCPAEL